MENKLILCKSITVKSNDSIRRNKFCGDQQYFFEIISKFDMPNYQSKVIEIYY